MAWHKWVKERGSGDPPSFSPLEEEGHCVVIGMLFVGNKPPREEPCVGEFYWDESGQLYVEFYKEEHEQKS